MRISVTSHFNRLKWNKFILQNKNASFYHNYGWTEIVKKNLGLIPKLIIAKKGRRLVGILPLFFRKGLFGTRLITLPLGEVDLLGNNETKGQLIKKAYRLTKKLGANLEIFTTQKMRNLPKNLYQNDEYAYYFLSTVKTYDKIFQDKFHKKTRNMVRKAEKAGIKVILGEKKDLNKFYKLYLGTMRKLGALPLSRKVFTLAWKKFPKESRLLKALYKDKVIGFLWIFLWSKRLWIWANATEENYLSLGTNYALYSKAVKIACKNKKIDGINFGGSEHGSSQEFFKLRWGTTKRKVFLTTNNYQATKSRWQSQKRLKTFIKRLPLWLFEFSERLTHRVY